MNGPPSTASAESSGEPVSSGRLSPRDGAWMAACWIPYVLLARKFYFLCDDAFISFRYAKNWAAGYGLRYNLGEHLPVEGYSNFLWVCLAALGEWAGLESPLWIPLVSFVAGSLLLVLLFQLLRRRFELPLGVVVPSCLFLTCSPSVAVWSTGGLETAPFALLVLLTCRQVILRRGGPAGATGALAALALALIRAEGIYWAVLIGLLGVGGQLLQSRRSFKPLVSYFVILLLGYAVYFVCRYGYYHSLLPNSAYVKVDISAATLDRGWDYVVVTYLTLQAPLVALFGFPLAWRAARRSIAVPVALLAVGFPAFAIVVGGDFMTMGRLLVPGWPFHAILLALLLEAIYSPARLRRTFAPGLGLGVVLVGLLPAWNLHLVPESIRARHHFRLNTDSYRSEYAQWEFMANKSEQSTELGRVLKEIAEPGDSVVCDVIGALGYYSDLFIYDQYGLVTPEVVEAARHAAYLHSPGHDVQVPVDFFIRYRPTFLNMFVVPLGPGAAPAIRTGVDRWRAKVDPNLYVAEIVNLVRITGNPEAPLLIILRLLPQGVSPEDMWARFRADLRLWSI